MSDLVEVSGLYKSFKTQIVLQGVDLVVARGSFTAILGPSGSGKTTLLRILAGFERPDRGSVVIAGTTVDDDDSHLPPERRKIGYVSQEGSLFPHLSVEANVGFGLPRATRKGKKVVELLEAVGLAGLERRYPHQLSGGQQQRVAIARALAVDPELVLLDEPFASLDATLRASVRSDVQAILRHAGATAILVTHDQDEALSIADRVAVIRGGTIAQLSSPEDLYAHPTDQSLAGFVGDANLIGGIAASDGVMTAFGLLEPKSPASGRVTVLVRPEQIEIFAASEQVGLRATVSATSFHGHDALVRLTTDAAGAIGGASVSAAGLGGTGENGADTSQMPEIVARVLGGHSIAPGDTVSLRVRGVVSVWPAASGA